MFADSSPDLTEPTAAAKTASSMNLWGYLVRSSRYLLPYRQLAFVSVALILLITLVTLLTPWPIKIVIDNVLGDQPLPPWLASAVAWLGAGPYTLLIASAAAGFFIVLTSNVLTVVQNYVNTKLQESIVLDFRSQLFQHAQRLSFAYHDQRRTGRVIFRAPRGATSRCRRSRTRAARRDRADSS